MALKHNKDNICAELRSLCNIPSTTPLTIHELKRRHRYGPPTNKHDFKSSALAVYTDKHNIDEVKELCNMHLQIGTNNRLFLPPNSIMIPCHPTLEIPAEIHERLIVKHNKCIHSLQQNTVTGLSWTKANTQLPIITTSNFAAEHPDINTISIIELIGLEMKKTQQPDPLTHQNGK
jgi:hypothetical protein